MRSLALIGSLADSPIAYLLFNLAGLVFARPADKFCLRFDRRPFATVSSQQLTRGRAVEGSLRHAFILKYPFHSVDSYIGQRRAVVRCSQYLAVDSSEPMLLYQLAGQI